MMNLKCIIYVFGIFLFNKTFADRYTADYILHSEVDFDITVVYRLRGNSINSVKCARPDQFFDDFKNYGCDGGEVHSRTNAIGVPITFNGRVLRSKNKDLEFIVDSHYRGNYFTKNHVEYDPLYWNICSTYEKWIPFIGFETRQAAGSLLQNNILGHSSTFNISWTPKETAKGCVSITYRSDSWSEDYKHLMIYERGNSEPIISHKLKTTTRPQDESATVILRTDSLFLENSTYDLVISHPKTVFKKRFGIKRIADCNNEDGDIYEISASEIRSSKIHKASAYYLNGAEPKDSVYSNKECGLNRFGADCSGICSTRNMEFCKLKLFCTSRYGCSCAPGYTGRFCDEDCPSGTFGRDCQQTCPKNCPNACDVFTGVCLRGCEQNPPNCPEST
ncbi:uncharacterized protein LOC126843281 [Adelges cooleyi]|uniref:uncharacterized protein LOC126843281 n=1 Tax=Adelges cooleyi TaxID=133065 RepID=UPI00217F8BD2|nr:uncharacterized protein LOC126843281 [Adelges cooleyi]